MSTANDRKRDVPELDCVVDMKDRAAAGLSPDAQFAIARGLRKFYGAMLDDPMPDKFARLLAALSRSENKDEI